MASRRLASNLLFDTRFEGVIEVHPRRCHDKQGHEGRAPQVLKVYHHAVTYFGQFFYHTVDLRRAHANTVAVDGGVRTTIDDRCASLGKQNPVAMAPFSGVLLEIAVQVALVILVAPEEQRHG